MSATTKRMIGYSAVIWVCLILTALIPLAILSHGAENLPAVATAEPAPWWQQVEAFQNLAIKWIGALTAVMAALATFVGIALVQYKNLKERIERVSDRADTIQSAALSQTANQAQQNLKTTGDIANLQPKP